MHINARDIPPSKAFCFITEYTPYQLIFSYIKYFLRNIWNDKGTGWNNDIAVYSIDDGKLETVSSGCFKLFGNDNFDAYIGKDFAWAIKKEVTYTVTESTDP